MTDPDLWARLQAVSQTPSAGPDLIGEIEAGLSLHTGHGAILWQEFLAMSYVEARRRARLTPSRILQDLGEWIAFEKHDLRSTLVQAAGLQDDWQGPVLTADETRAAYREELDREPVAQVWPREMPGKGRRTARGLGVAFILMGAVWRLAERQIQVEAFAPVIPKWLPLVLAVVVGTVALAFAPRAVAHDPADAWQEGEAGR